MKNSHEGTKTLKQEAVAGISLQTPHRLIPKLRFPEFRGGLGWEEKTLAEICTVNPSNAELPESFFYIDLESVEAGKLTAPKKINRDEAPSRAQRLLERGDTIFQVVRPYQRNNFFFDFTESESYVASTGYAQLRAHKSQEFLYQIIHTDGFVNKVIAKCTGSNYPAINSSDLAEIPLAVPPSLPEQQKIATCLTSLDTLIAAHSQKLDAIKTHKKGLMQQLFPREGETIPRLRFPEFQDAGEWEEEKLGAVCKKIMDGTHFSPKTKSGPRAYLTSKNIQDGKIDLSKLSYISEEEHREIFKRCPVKLNDVLLTKDGANTGNCAINGLTFEFSLLSSVAVLRGKPTLVDQRFLYQAMLSDRTQRLIRASMSGQAITRITLEKIGNFSISFADLDEQHRIASCLSSLDDLIAAQAQKLEALKTHKKGMMQQLFPSPEATGATQVSPLLPEATGATQVSPLLPEGGA